jgi:transmembrane sensor
MNSPERIGKLLFRHIRKELSTNESAELSAWRKLSERNELLFQTETNPEHIQKVISEMYDSREYTFQKFKDIYPQYQEEKPKKRRGRIYRITRVAAILIVVFSIGYYFIDKELSIGHAGTYKAELISDNNISRALDDFQRGFNDGKARLKIEKDERGVLIYIVPNNLHAGKEKYNTVRTPRGGEFSVRFPDGSMAWLNAESSIRYPMNFSSYSILLEVKGEVYFEVATNNKHLYTISLPSSVIGHPSSNKSVQIKTTGAHFDIQNYHDVNSGVLVTEGVATVEIDSVGGKELSSEIVHPGEEAKIFNRGVIVAMVQNINELIAWKYGVTSFHKAHIQEIMSDISRWYDVDVEYMGEIPNKTFNLNISRDANLKELLAALREQGIHLYLHAGKVTVSP